MTLCITAGHKKYPKAQQLSNPYAVGEVDLLETLSKSYITDNGQLIPIIIRSIRSAQHNFILEEHDILCTEVESVVVTQLHLEITLTKYFLNDDRLTKLNKQK